MKRLAAHYVVLPDESVWKQHYIELDDENHLLGVFPLEKEIARTAFLNGVLVLRPCGEKVEIYHLDSVELLPAKFGTDDGGSSSHIQRVG